MTSVELKEEIAVKRNFKLKNTLMLFKISKEDKDRI